MSTSPGTVSESTGELQARHRLVIFASSLGTVFEWYDFYLYAVLALFFSGLFFPSGNPVASNLAALATFGAGFGVRPFGAIVFGRIGDIVGRKYTFLITIVVMGLSTALVGLLPTYAPAGGWPGIGIWAPILLVTLRLAQGLALGGEYGGAATYVAEHAPKGKRGLFTSWIQTTATIGFFLALLLVLGVRTYVGEDAFAVWGWRIPFLVSIVLLAVSLWIRLQLNESPMFLKMKEEGTRSKAPLREAFGTWRYARIAILALLGATAGEAVVWYGGQFYALFFLTTTLSIKPTVAQIMIAIALALGTPFFILFGWLSDKIGRKPIIMARFALAALTYFPIFHAITHYANPALEAALANSPVTVTADQRECAFQFNPVGTAKFKSSCDTVKSGLARLSVNYKNVVAPPGTTASVQIGDEIIAA